MPTEPGGDSQLLGRPVQEIGTEDKRFLPRSSLDGGCLGIYSVQEVCSDVEVASAQHRR